MRILPGLFWCLTASIFVLTANGCSSGGGSNESFDLEQLQRFEAQAVQRFCARLSACCSELSYPYDEAGCKALNGNPIVQFFNFQAFPGSRYDPAAAKRCLDSIETPELGCSAKGDYESEECQKVFVGSVPLGGKCSRSEGCIDEGTATTCKYPPNPNFSDPDLVGVCVAVSPSTGPHGKAGEACSSSCTDFGLCSTLCSDGQTCETDLPSCYESDGLFCSEANTCVPLGVAGDPCRGSTECGAGTYCDFELERCEPLLHESDACRDELQCDTGYCKDGTCTSRPRANPDYCLGHIPPPPH